MNSHLLQAALLLHHSGFLFAQASSLDNAIGKGMGILARIAYLGAFAMIIAASWNVQKGQSESAKWAVMGALIAAVASLIVKALFAAGEIPINITPSSN
jgi:riboflavin transporter FmnP